MGNRILQVHLPILITLLVVASVSAQSTLPKNWDTEKIKGSALLAYPSASGHYFFNEKFWNGGIEFLDGVKIGDLKLRYGEYRDELIYYNQSVLAQIIVDKISLRGFWMTDSQGVKHVFRQLFYSGYSPGNRFFEVLDSAEVSLLVYRKVILEICSPYYDIFGRLNNMAFQEAFAYYLYHPKKGFEQIKVNRSSLLSKFSQSDQADIKKFLRKNRNKVSNEPSLIEAWKLIQGKKIKTICKFSN
jgi:hypothetical protein